MNDSVPGLEETTIQVKGKGTIRITRQDAQLLGAALLQRLRESDQEMQEALLPQVQNLKGWIGYDGYVRIGRWLLSPTFGKLAFMFRPSLTGYVLYAAPVRQTQEGWVVDPVYRVRVVPPR